MIKYTLSVKSILVFLGLSYVILSSLKIHTSSIAAWDYFLGKDYTKSVIIGTPQTIRQDEWMVNTPNSINLYDKKPRSFSESLRYILKPKDWPHLFLSKNEHEKKFAFSWNMNIFGFLASSFLVLLLVSKNNVLLSITGSLLIFLSSSFQWWSYSLGMHMTSMNMLLLGVIYFMYSDKVPQIILSAWLVVAGLYSTMIDGLYPAWQVPMGYMYITLLIGYIYENRGKAFFSNYKKLRIGLVLVGLIGLIIVGMEYYQQIYAQAKDMLNTIYPGNRFATGGDIVLSHLFIEYYNWFIRPDHVPATWGNICEASSVILVLPIIVYGIVSDVLSSRMDVKFILPMLIFNLIMVIWMVIGFPPFLSKITLMSFSPGPRTMPIFGIANIFLLVIYLSRRTPSTKFDLKRLLIGTSFIMIYLLLVHWLVDHQTNGFFTSYETILSLLTISAIYLGILYFDYKKVSIFACALLVLFSSKNLAIHPVNKGLKPLIRNEITTSALDIKRSDPNARWGVFGSPRFAALLSPTRIDKINGLVPTPNFKDLAILDPSKRYEEVYNRYAHIALSFHPSIGEDIIFQSPDNKSQLDYYTIIIHPCNKKLKELKVKYLLFTYKPSEEETKCLTLMHDLGQRFIYQIN